MKTIVYLWITLSLALPAHAASPDPDWPDLFPVAGEPQNGFPSWYERFIHVMVNRSRADPPVDLAACINSGACPDGVCFPTPLPAMGWDYNLARAARFHAANLTATGCGMMHNSPCQLVSNISDLYPGSCDGSAACACSGGTASCSGGNDFASRLSLFGASPRAENIAWLGDPFDVFYAWLHENASTGTCAWSMENGHRWNILGDAGTIGVGGQGGYTVQDFSYGGPSTKLVVGAHYPESGSSVDFYASWYDTAAPSLATVDVDGTCTPMTVERGTGGNVVYKITQAVGAGCHRYAFVFKTSGGTRERFPSTGAFGIGCGEDWTVDPLAEGAGCDCTPSCDGRSCGDNGCGGSCGECTAPLTCSIAFACACPTGTEDCSGACADLQTDEAHCGTCGNACTGQQNCISGECSTDPEPDAGTDTDTDVDHEPGNAKGDDCSCRAGTSGSPAGGFPILLLLGVLGFLRVRSLPRRRTI
ncbi:hypothetical protein KKD52_17460 [Myxococcota bacterium]|nr:hypothetical protein [Myxococcota bacterium]MBU1512144.1 hypothetical protein [Myxococcota bacterium]